MQIEFTGIGVAEIDGRGMGRLTELNSGLDNVGWLAGSTMMVLLVVDVEMKRHWLIDHGHDEGRGSNGVNGDGSDRCAFKGAGMTLVASLLWLWRADVAEAVEAVDIGGVGQQACGGDGSKQRQGIRSELEEQSEPDLILKASLWEWLRGGRPRL